MRITYSRKQIILVSCLSLSLSVKPVTCLLLSGRFMGKIASHSSHGPEWLTLYLTAMWIEFGTKFFYGVQNCISLGQLWLKIFLLIFGKSEKLNPLWRSKSTKSQLCRCVYNTFQVTGTNVYRNYLDQWIAVW